MEKKDKAEEYGKTGTFQTPIAEKIYRNTIRQLLIFSGTCLLLLLGVLEMKAILQQHFWMEENKYYMVLHFLDQWRYRIPFLIFLCGNLLIIYRAYRKSIRYLDNAIVAASRVVDEDEGLIELPDQFKEIETKFNELKLQIQNNIREAKDAEQRKNDLVMYLAHDLKTPLTSVIGYLTLLQEAEDLPEEFRLKYTGIALDKAERLEDLINEFFDITRFNLAGFALEKSYISLGRLLEQLTYEFSPMFQSKNLSCRLDLEEEICYCCDGDKMQRVFDNLLRNAVNYSYPASQIEIRLDREQGMIHIRFSNHGDTIPKEKLTRLFEQFFRLDSSRSSSNGGAGLGLAIAREIVERHGGKILASSEENMIFFDIYLPGEM